LAKKVGDANRLMRWVFPEKVTLQPRAEAGKGFYEAIGKVNLYGLAGFTVVASGVRPRRLW